MEGSPSSTREGVLRPDLGSGKHSLPRATLGILDFWEAVGGVEMELTEFLILRPGKMFHIF